MKLTEFFDRRNIIAKYDTKKNKDGLKDFHIAGYYYLGLIIRAYFKYGITAFPFFDIKYFDRALMYYLQEEHPDKRIESVYMTLSFTNPKKLSYFLRKDFFRTLPYFILGNRLIPLYPILLFYDILNLFRKEEDLLVIYQLYRNVTPFKLHIYLLNKIVKRKKMNEILQSYFNPLFNMPPLYILFDKLIEKVVK